MVNAQQMNIVFPTSLLFHYSNTSSLLSLIQGHVCNKG